MKKLILTYLIVLSVLTVAIVLSLRMAWPEQYPSLLFIIPLFYAVMLGVMVWLKRSNERKGNVYERREKELKKIIAILSLMFLIAVPAMAQESAQDETVDVKGVIFGHLKDSYHWHIITIGQKEVSLHLPVILYSKVSGWHFFSSRELEHTGSYEGFHITGDGAHAGKLVETLPDGTELKPLDLSLTKIALAVIINSLLLCVIVMCTARAVLWALWSM